MDWPWWVGVFLALVLFGVGLGVLFLWKLWERRRDPGCVRRAAESGRLPVEEDPHGEQGRLRELRDSWKGALAMLKHSHLKNQGNPLYVLPWYLVLGGSGSGKTTAIKSASLFSPFAQERQDVPSSGASTCGWWFFDQAILIDTPGRYVLGEAGRENVEWQEFLCLLARYRKREALHGLIVTLAADKLLKSDPRELETEGRQLRSRMDELMRALGVKFPVYLLITKCDLVRGMTDFSRRLPDQSLDQPMGVANGALCTDVPGFLEQCMASTTERLKELRLLLVHRQEPSFVGADLLLFPDELQRLKPGLLGFMRAAFQENRYQDTPLLRGIYLGSGEQETLNSPVFNGVLPGASRGLFLHDFFAKVLPGDRGLLARTARFLKWRDLTRNLGLSSWVLVAIAFCGLLSYSFVKNLATIREAGAVIATTPGPSGDPASMERFRRMVVTVEKKNRDWWMPRFGLDESLQLEADLKARYCREFQERFLGPLDRETAATAARFSGATPEELSGRYLVHMSRRINLLTARLAGAGADALRRRPPPGYPEPSLQEGEAADRAGRFAPLYLDYLAWQPDRGELGRELKTLQSLLKQLYLVKGSDLRWLAEYLNREQRGSGVTLRSFWGGSRPIAGEPQIAPAFTRKGGESLSALVGELAAAYPEAGGLEREKADFQNWHRGASLDAWQKFATQFSRGEEGLSGASEWQSAARVMAGEKGPYLGLVKRVLEELEPLGIAEGAPPWLSRMRQFQALQAAMPAPGNSAPTGEAPERVVEKSGKLAVQEQGALIRLPAQVTSGMAVRDYLEALARVAPAANSRRLAHQMALQGFGEDPEGGQSPIHLAADAARRVDVLLSGERSDETFTRLLAGPVAFYGTYLRMETACALQRGWEEQVIKEAQGAADPQSMQYLLGKEGPVWKFVSTSADPFLGWNPGRGYYSKPALGGTLPFEPAFFAFLTKGAKAKIALAAPARQDYNVTVKGLPTDANAEARTKPHSTRLEMQCASGPQSMENLNFPVSKTFAWSPETCGQVLFQVEVGDVVLSKKYPGFPDFLQDFPLGRHTFHPGDFPQESEVLRRMGIRYIRANYQLSGASELLSGQAKTLPGQLPAKIIQCWD